MKIQTLSGNFAICVCEFSDSLRRIRSYLKKWALWWAKTAGEWHPHDILQAFISACRPEAVAELAMASAIQRQFTELCMTGNETSPGLDRDPA